MIISQLLTEYWTEFKEVYGLNDYKYAYQFIKSFTATPFIM